MNHTTAPSTNREVSASSAFNSYPVTVLFVTQSKCLLRWKLCWESPQVPRSKRWSITSHNCTGRTLSWIARPPEFSRLPDLTSQRENDFKDWTSCLSFSKIQHLEATDSPSLFSTCTIMTENELSPLKSPGGCGSSAFYHWPSLLHRAAPWLLCHFRYRKRKATDSFVFPFTVVFTLTYLKESASKVHLEKPNRLKRVSKEC